MAIPPISNCKNLSIFIQNICIIFPHLIFSKKKIKWFVLQEKTDFFERRVNCYEKADDEEKKLSVDNVFRIKKIKKNDELLKVLA